MYDKTYRLKDKKSGLEAFHHIPSGDWSAHYLLIWPP